MRRIAVLFGVIVLLLLVQCAGESGDNVPAGPRIMYKVTYADGRPGEVHVKYFSPGANRILEEDVDTPWTSEIFHASRGTVLRVEVVGIVRSRVMFSATSSRTKARTGRNSELPV